MNSFKSVKGTELRKMKIMIAGIINISIVKNYKDHLSVFNTLFIPATENNGSGSITVWASTQEMAKTPSILTKIFAVVLNFSIKDWGSILHEAMAFFHILSNSFYTMILGLVI
jgi:hypothetical protein